VWTVEVRTGHLESCRVIVHLFQEILDEVRVVIELVAANALDVLLTIAFAVEDKLAKVLRECKCCIVT